MITSFVQARSDASEFRLNQMNKQSKAYDMINHQPRENFCALFLNSLLRIAIICLVGTATAIAQTASDSIPTSRVLQFGGWRNAKPKVADTLSHVYLAFSGGGARGLSAIGILKAFEKRKIKIVGITGVSMGAIIGGLAACGYSARQLESLVFAIDFSELLLTSSERQSVLVSRRDDQERHLVNFRFDGFVPRLPTGLLSAPRLTTEFNLLTLAPSLAADNDFSKLTIPFRAVATDIVSGTAVLFEKGSLAEAMRASMAFPLAFTGIPRDSGLLMDGGMRVPIPVLEARRMRSDSTIPVIAIDMTSPLMPRNQLKGLFEIASQVTGVMTQELLARELAAADIVIRPKLDSLKAVDFSQASELIASGYAAGLRVADSLNAIPRASIKQVQKIRIAEIRVNGQEPDSNLRADLMKIRSEVELSAVASELIRDGKVWSLTASIRTDLRSDVIEIDSIALPVTIEVTTLPSLGYLTLNCKGNTAFASHELVDSPLIPYERLTAPLIDSLITQLLEKYKSEKLTLARVDTVLFHSDTMTIVIDEGLIARVDVEGSDRAKDWLVRSYSELNRGEPFRQDLVHRGLDQLLGTGLFEQVRLELVRIIPTRESHGTIVAKLIVQEEPPAQLRIGAHWNSEYEGEFMSELLDDNIAGVGLQGMLRTVYGERRFEIAARSKLERIFDTYLTARAELFYKRIKRNVYDENLNPDFERVIQRSGFEAQLGQQFRGLGLLVAGIRFQEVSEQATTEPKLRFGLRSLFFGSRVDTYDRRYFQTRGIRQSFTLDLTGKVFGGKIEYSRFHASIEHTRSFGKRFAAVIGGELGFSRKGLPFSEQFTLGGPTQLPGYRIDQLSGEKMLNVVSSLRYKLPVGAYGSVRMAVGAVASRTEQIKLDNLRSSIGLFLSLDLPIGPVELGYAVSEERPRWHFSAGFSF